jgi:hypothetical protein
MKAQRISDFRQIASEVMARYHVNYGELKLVSDLDSIIFQCQLQGGQYPWATLRFYPALELLS